MIDRKALAAAFPATIPVLMGYLAIGIAFGLMLQEIGYNFIWAFFMSLTIYAGSGQYLGVTLLSTCAGLGTVALMTLNINGQNVTPTKSNGEAAEVFAYDGATYVPLRYLSELLGITVEWDKNDPTTAKLTGDITLPAGGDGTYTGVAAGFGGEVKAVITVVNGKLTACTLEGAGETPAIGGAALPKL